jgi:hypothetical protein
MKNPETLATLSTQDEDKVMTEQFARVHCNICKGCVRLTL